MRDNKPHKSKFFLVLYAFTSGVYLNLVGRLMLAEMIAFLSFPLFTITALLKEFKGLRVVVKGLLFMLLLQVLSDYVNNSSSIDYLRGWSVIIFSIISTIFLVKHFSNNSNAIVPYFFVLFITRLLFVEQDLDLNSMVDNSNLFKARFVGFLNIGVMLIGYYLYRSNKFRLVVITFFMYAILCFVLNARSNGLIFSVSSALLFVKSTNMKFSKGKVFMLSIFVSGIFYLGYIYYVNKVLNNDVRSSMSMQLGQMSNPYNPFELLYYGRNDAVIAIYAITDNPLLGFGSWAKDKNGKYSKIQGQLLKSETLSERTYIPNHSLILGTWLYSGVFGFLGICYILRYLLKEFFRIYNKKIISPILPVLTVLSIDMCWAMCFSPYGLLRTSFPIFAALIIVFQKKYEQI